MDASFYVTAAEVFQKRAEQALANGYADTAKKNYVMAASRYREAAKMDPMNSGDWEEKAQHCEQMAARAGQPTAKGSGNSGSKNTDSAKPNYTVTTNSQSTTKQKEATEKDKDTKFDEEKFNESMSKLNGLIGLKRVKKEVSQWVDTVRAMQMRKDAGLAVPDKTTHLVFKGNPGTGKTTVARLMANICHSLGFLSKGHLVETDANGMLAGYVGQTGDKTLALINEAYGGVLFIDEAYSVVNEGNKQFGQAAIDTLTKAMEDKRDDLIVIVAGYDKPMDDFLATNEGLASRFSSTLHFDDYNADELYAIFERNCAQSEYVIDPAAQPAFRQYINNMYDHRDEKFGNAREMRKFFEKIVDKQASRMVRIGKPTREQQKTITEEDLIQFERDKEL